MEQLQCADAEELTFNLRDKLHKSVVLCVKHWTRGIFMSLWGIMWLFSQNKQMAHLSFYVLFLGHWFNVDLLIGPCVLYLLRGGNILCQFCLSSIHESAQVWDMVYWHKLTHYDSQLSVLHCSNWFWPSLVYFGYWDWVVSNMYIIWTFIYYQNTFCQCGGPHRACEQGPFDTKLHSAVWLENASLLLLL